MRASILSGVWAYTLLSVLVEVYAAETIANTLFVVTAITAFALSQAAAIVLFYMNLKEEPGSLRLLILIPMMFLSGLLITLVASQG